MACLADRFRSGAPTTLIVVCAACLLTPGTALAGTLDQQQTEAVGGGTIVDSVQSVAQTFTAGLSGGLDQVDLNLQAPSGTPTAYLSVELRDVSGGAPGGMILASRSVPVSSVSATAAFVPVTFAPPAPVVAGTQYAIVAYTASPIADFWGWSYGLTANPYAGGAPLVTASSPPSAAWTSGTRDFEFKTYVVPSPSPSTGQRAAGLKKCKKKAKKKAAASKKKRCKKKKRTG